MKSMNNETDLTELTVNSSLDYTAEKEAGEKIHEFVSRDVSTYTTENSYTLSKEEEDIIDIDESTLIPSYDIDPSIANVSVQDVTKNVQVNADTFEVTGDGVFDDLMETVTKHYQAQFDAGRIRQEDFGTLYSAAAVEVMKMSMEFVLTKAKVRAEVLSTLMTVEKLKQETIATAYAKEAAKYAILRARNESEKVKADIFLTNAQRLVADAQRKGFMHNEQLKLFEKITELWSMAFTVSGSDSSMVLPNVTKSDLIDKLIQDIGSQVGLGSVDPNNTDFPSDTSE